MPIKHITDERSKFVKGELRSLRRQRPVSRGGDEWFLMPGSTIVVGECNRNCGKHGVYFVYSVHANLVDSKTKNESELHFFMSQRDLQQHTRPEETQDELSRRTRGESDIIG